MHRAQSESERMRWDVLAPHATIRLWVCRFTVLMRDHRSRVQRWLERTKFEVKFMLNQLSQMRRRWCSRSGRNKSMATQCLGGECSSWGCKKYRILTIPHLRCWPFLLSPPPLPPPPLLFFSSSVGGHLITLFGVFHSNLYVVPTGHVTLKKIKKISGLCTAVLWRPRHAHTQTHIA